MGGIDGCGLVLERHDRRRRAYHFSYDAFRKSAASLLAAQGLPATSRGGHITIQEAVLGNSAHQCETSGRSVAFAAPQQLRPSAPSRLARHPTT
jgi:hypothetical protein